MPATAPPPRLRLVPRMPAPRSEVLPDDDALACRTGALLASHVPLTLLLDIAECNGPHSHDLLVTERGSADWLRRV